MPQRTGKPARGARNAKAPQQSAIDVWAQHPESLRGADQMRQRYRRDGQSRVDDQRQDWREQTPDAKPADRRQATGRHRGHKDQNVGEHANYHSEGS